MMKYVKLCLLLFLGILILAFIINYPKLKLISGFAAKNMASSYFLAHRGEQITNEIDNGDFLVSLATTKVNGKAKEVISNVFGLSSKKAIYRKGLGAVLVNDKTDLTIDDRQPKRNFTPINKPYPYGNLKALKPSSQNVNIQEIDRISQNCFTENYTDGIKNTRSLLVLYKGQIIAEKYADGFDEHSLLQGWSMTKSLLTTCFGVLERTQNYDIHAPITAFPNWLSDERKNITTNHLLRMESGLEWEENYGTVCDVTKMLFDDEDVCLRPINKPQTTALETTTNYSSGSSNILSALLRKQFKTHQEYLDFPYQELIDKIGMHSMLLETDIKGNYVASSYSWATTRDWGKLGQLMLNNGVWNGEQILSKNWVDYIKTPNKTSKGEYGGQWWINTGNYMPNVPKDCFYADGFQGQRIFVIPSKDLVVVRFGVTKLGRTGFYPLFDKLLSKICMAID